MVRAVFLTCGDLDQAVEVVDEAFLQVFTRMRSAPVDNVRGYLWRAAFNGSRRARDRRRRSAAAVELVGRRTPAATAGPEEAASWWEITESLAALDPVTRSAIVLRFYGDFTVPEVAEQLGVPLGTAKSLIHRGLAALRQGLDTAVGSDAR